MSDDPSKLIPSSPSDEDYQLLREEAQEGSDEALFTGEDPFALFAEWLARAREREPRDANAMALGTTGADGLPDVRMVLLKDVSGGGFVFYTNTESRKGGQLAQNAKAAVCFHWKSLGRQVRAQGAVEPVTDAEAVMATVVLSSDSARSTVTATTARSRVRRRSTTSAAPNTVRGPGKSPNMR